MPKLNTRGQMLGSSDGAGVVSVDRVPILTSAGQGNWLTDDVVIVNGQYQGFWQVLTVPGAGGAPKVLDAGGANTLVAGGGRWLGWTNGRGMFGSLPPRPWANPLGAGTDGTLAWCPNRQAGIGLVLTAVDGGETTVADAVVYDVQVLGPTSAVWWDSRAMHAVGRAVPTLAIAPSGLSVPRLATIDGEDWWLYWREEVGLIVQIDGAADGYVLETRPICYGFDLAAVGGQLLVAWSVTPGEGPQDLVCFPIDRTAPRVPLVVPTPIPPDPEPPEPPDPEPEPPDPEPAPEPEPEPPYAPINEAPMTTEQGWLVGPGDKVVSIDAAGHVTFTRTELTEADLFEATPQPEDIRGRCAVRSTTYPAFALGADATKHTPTGNVCQQLYGKTATDSELGHYELWAFGQWPSGIVEAVIEYIEQGADHGRSWHAAGLTWVRRA